MTSLTNWRAIQRLNFSNWKNLLTFLELDEEPDILKEPRFPLNVPLRLAEKMEKGNPNDPIFLQFVPSHKENEIAEGFSEDPVEDFAFRKEKKLLKKYKGRALLVTTSACAMNCRFCFRQNFDYEIEERRFTKELEAIAADEDLAEIILSGGDPLSLSDEVLDNLIQGIEAIPHVKRLRFHTRFPIGIPERINDSFLHILAKTRLQVVFLIHANHPKELDEDVLQALKKVQKLGIPVLSQSVLLNGVNDDLATLKELYLRFCDHGIIPYYLNQLDRVQGSQHFEVELEKGLMLMEALRQEVSGYAVPKFMQEIPGEPYKTELTSSPLSLALR